jgi:diguanylate cyclase (GGDEF)-like protein
VWNRRKNGEAYPQLLSITEVRNADGQVINYVGAMTDITQRKQSEEEIQRLAYYDHLTGFPNRRMLLDRLQHALAYAVRGSRSVALLFIDLDNFKILNDTLGHDKGHLLLQQVAKRLTDCVRDTDTVARIGGDEFVVMLEDLSGTDIDAPEQARLVAEKILASLAVPFQLARHDYTCTSSIGIALFNGQQQEFEELLKQADIAMYQAKSAGRNTLRFFDSKMQDAINMRVEIETELRCALDKGQFQLHYQIQKNHRGEALGAEALIRWNHPQHGMMPPAQFIPVAEETGLILSIGHWVIESACAQLAAWARHPHMRKLALAVNVSARQFHQPGFADQVKQAITRHGIAPTLLKLELTESLLLENIDDTLQTMNMLNAIGVQLSLDDFDTGYSSLQYLKRLPVDQLKIDRTFVHNIVTDPSDQAIVRTIIAMANSLSLDVIAEGVETAEQERLLLNSQCTSYQGFLLGKPLPADQFESLLSH